QAAAEDVPEGRHDIFGRPEVMDRGAVEPGMPITIVALALVRIRKHLIGFGRFLESLGGRLVTRVPVRMIFQRQLAIGLLDLVGAGVALDAQQLVIIPLRGRHRHGISMILRVAAGESHIQARPAIDARSSLSLRISYASGSYYRNSAAEKSSRHPAGGN